MAIRAGFGAKKGLPLAKPFTLRGLPRPPLDRGGGIAQAMTERFSPLRLTVRLCLSTTSQALRASSPSRGASGEEEKFSAMPKPPLQGATATTAASGGNREELLGPRPAGCERQRSRRWEPQPGQWHGVSRDGEVVRRERLWQAGRCKTPFRRLLLREGRVI